MSETGHSEGGEDHGRSLVSNWTMEVGTAIALIAFATVVMVSNYRLGAGWSATGPEPGYFPFYVGAFIFISGVAILVQQILRRAPDKGGSFVDSRPMLRVLQIFIPTVIYVIVVAYLGIYVASAIFISGFMVWLGHYKLYVAIPIAIAISVALFITFEIWFLVPLPKGPLEIWLGY